MVRRVDRWGRPEELVGAGRGDEGIGETSRDCLVSSTEESLWEIIYKEQ